MDRVAVLLLLAGVSGASIFLLFAQKDHLFATVDDSAFPASNGTSSDTIYYTPTDGRNAISSNSLFHEKRLSESDYAFLEDERQERLR